MSLLQAHSRNDYLGNNSTATYAFTFRVQSASQLKVIKLDTLANETVLSLNTDFTVSGVGAASGGTITLTAGNLPLNYRLAILRLVPLTQETDIRNQGAFYPEIHEDVFDRLTAIDQQQQDAIDRSLRLSEAINPGSFEMELPASVVANPNATIVVNATGNGLGVGPTTTAIINSEANANAASASASAAAASASAAAASASAAAANAAAGLWKDVVFITSAQSPVSPVQADTGKLYVVDCTAGNVVFSLPLISSLDLSKGWSIGVKKSDVSANTVTINSHAADVVEGAASFVLSKQNFGVTLIPDIDPVPDAWTAVYFGDVRNLYSPTIYAPTVDVMTIDGQAATPANPSAGFYKTYIKDIDSKMYVLKSDGTEIQIGSGAGGGINYILNPDAETTVSNWATYADAAASTPVDGTGGSPNITFTRTTTSPLRGIGSFLLTKDAANRQGQGFSYDFTIDRSDRLQVLRGSFEFEVSGSYADDVIEIFIYDVTNSNLLYCSPSKIKNSSMTEKFTFEFQTSSSTSYRMIGHITSTSASAFTMKFDNFSIAPNPKGYGSLMTDWLSYSASFAGMGTTSAANVLYRRNGSNIEVNGVVTTGTISGIHSISLPPGLTLDTSKLSITANTTSNPGTVVGTYAQSATNAQGYLVTAPGTANNLLYLAGNAGASATAITPTASSIASTSVLSFNFIAPILGWSSQSQLVSSDADTRIVAMSASGTVADVSANAPMIFSTVLKDTHGAYNTSTGQYTCQSAGWYQIESSVSAGGTTTARIHTYINGTLSKQIGLYSGTGVQMFVASGLEYLTVGQTLDIRPNAAITGFANTGSLSIFKVTGPSQIMASESVSVKYTDSSAAAISTSIAVYKFLTKEVDSHGSYSTSTGLFTCPANGVYKIDAHLSHVTNLTTSQQCDILIYKNGVSIKRHTMYGNGIGNRKSLILSDLVRLVVGDTIGIYAYSDVATNAVNDVQYNSFSIVRAGI